MTYLGSAGSVFKKEESAHPLRVFANTGKHRPHKAHFRDTISDSFSNLHNKLGQSRVTARDRALMKKGR